MSVTFSHFDHKRPVVNPFQFGKAFREVFDICMTSLFYLYKNNLDYGDFDLIYVNDG